MRATVCRLPSAVDARHGRGGFREGVAETAAMGLGEGGPVLVPGQQVARRGDGQPRLTAVPLRVEHHVEPLVGLHDARVLDAAGPLQRGLRIDVGIKDRLGQPSEMHAVVREGAAQPGGALSDPLARAVLGPVEQHHPAVVHRGRGVERVALLPGDPFAPQGTEEAGRRVGGDDRIGPFGTPEPGPGPFGRRGGRLRAGRGGQCRGKDQQPDTPAGNDRLHGRINHRRAAAPGSPSGQDAPRFCIRAPRPARGSPSRPMRGHTVGR